MSDLGAREEVKGPLNEASSEADGRDALDDWFRLSSLLGDAERRGVLDPADALALVRRESEQGHASTSGVAVTTFHKSKGLEFRAVALVGVDGTTFGTKKLEDRLLLYVGVTRARERLAVFTPNSLSPLAVTSGLTLS
jgi:superfamily I DNA/RNA helicase